VAATKRKTSLTLDVEELEGVRDLGINASAVAEASGGTCLFVMPVARDFTAIDREITRR